MNIILVHLGNKRFSHLIGTLNQLLYFKNKNIYLITEKKVIKYLRNYKYLNKINFVNKDLITKDLQHNSFLKNTRLNKSQQDGFWLKTVERFFYIENFVKKKKLKNIVHIENDILIFGNLNRFETRFKKMFNIGLTFLNTNNCIPGFMFFRDHKSIYKITEYIYKKNRFFFQKKNLNDMRLLANFYNENKKNCKIGMFPTLTKELAIKYHNNYLDIKDFYKNFDNLKIIFDACALGQLIDGLDKKYHLHKGKFINKENVIDPNNFDIKFKIKKQIKFPYLMINNKQIPIINLHMHSKNTKKFINLKKK